MDVIVDNTGTRFSPRGTNGSVYGCDGPSYLNPEVRFHESSKPN